MTHEELDVLAQKIEQGTATEDEKLLFYQQMNEGADEIIRILESMPDVSE